ncbi:sulfotransferase family protein [Rhabdochromatium marinum]|uniref:sulfotransferase family protein n=1 Tax=Rhabdochromatium marinum TaxID=48729 RepID=UPI001A915D76|nr:sulfotransferase [Rhabdochromatium marinum]
MIKALFPKARIIHCQRDPMATCWSIFSHPFNEHHYAHRLDILGQHYRQYQRLMAHWEQVLPMPIYSVRYEQLVREPTSMIPALLDHCQLPFEQACLAPHLNDRPVLTASAHQVVKPIYMDRINFWKNYKPYLMDLHQALYGEGDTNEDSPNPN